MIGLIEAAVALHWLEGHGRPSPRERTDWLIDEAVYKLHDLKEGGSP